MFNFTWNSLRKVTHVEQPRPESGAVTDLRCIYDRIGLISFLRHVEGFILAREKKVFLRVLPYVKRKIFLESSIWNSTHLA